MTWRSVPLRSVYRRVEESDRPDLPLLSVYRDHGVVLRAGRKDNYNKASDDLTNYKVVRPGDLVLNKMKTWQGSLGVSRHEGIVSPAYFVGRPVADVDERFMHHLLRSLPLIAEYGARSKGIRPSQWDLAWDEFASIKVRLPDLREQRTIADYLDTETARIDALIIKKGHLLLVNEERAMQRQAHLARGGEGDRERRCSGIDWLGAIPASWRISRLKYEARLESGHTPSRTRPELWENCTIPWVTLNDVGHMAMVEFIKQTTNLISEAGIAASSARVLPAGTVILSRDATIGRTAILAVPMATSQHFADWICSERLDPRYLWLVFRTLMKAHFDSLTDGATLRTIGMPDIRELVVPVPPIDEQHGIIRAAEVVRRREAKTSAALLRQIELLREHRQALITAAVTGEFDVPVVAA